MTVIEDISCQCTCKTRPSDCHSGQSYSGSRCQCECEDLFEKAQCVILGKEWDESTCTCTCPSPTWTPCSTGYFFDFHDSCSCIRIQDLSLSESCNSFLSLVVILFVCLILSTSAAVFFVRRRQEEQSIKHYCYICEGCILNIKEVSTTMECEK